MCSPEDVQGLAVIGLLIAGVVSTSYSMWTYLHVSYYAVLAIEWIISWSLVWEFILYSTRGFAVGMGLVGVALMCSRSRVPFIHYENTKLTNIVGTVHCETIGSMIPPAA